MLKTKFLIWSRERQAYWKPDRKGYTDDLSAAGRYPFFEACSIVAEANAHDLSFNRAPLETMIADGDIRFECDTCDRRQSDNDWCNRCIEGIEDEARTDGYDTGKKIAEEEMKNR